MLINSAQKMSPIQRRISIEFRDPAHQLSANILGSYLWRYLYLPSISCLIHEHLGSCIIRCPLLTGGNRERSGRVLDLRLRGREFESHRRHCVVVLEQDTFILA